MQTARVLANAVIPNEYGIDPGGKLRIGSKICAALLGKILADLGNMREESIATANVQVNKLAVSKSRVLVWMIAMFRLRWAVCGGCRAPPQTCR